MKKFKKSLLALSLSCSIANQNAMIIINSQEVKSDKSTEKSAISQGSTEDTNFQPDPESNPTYSMGGSASKSLPNSNITNLTNPNAIGNGNVTSNSLNVRSGPSTSNEILGTVKNGENFDILKKEKDWYKISFNNKQGYVSSSHIALNPIQKGIDVSKWNGDINWSKVKASGVDYVIIRAGYGTSTLDPYFKTNIQGAINAGLEVGVYWFSYATTPAKATMEAEYCLKALEPYKKNISYPVFFDFEYDSVDYAKKQGVTITKDSATKFANAFISEVESQGYDSGIYTNQDFGNTYFTSDSLLSNNLWIAQYRSSCTYTKPYMMWQYSDKGVVSGISGSVDMNYTYLKSNSKAVEVKDLSSALISNIASQTYTGSKISPKFEITLNGNTLSEEKDYTVTYENNLSVGVANIMIKGIGNYSGSLYTSFKILPKEVTELNSTDKTTSSIKLQWTKVDDVTGYEIYKLDSKTNSYNLINTTDNNTTFTYTDSNLSSNTNYSYKVRAYKKVSNENFYGNYSDILSATTSSSTINPSTPSTYGVTTANLNMRKSASTSSSIITTIAKGSKIEIIEKTSSSWYKVKYSGKTGYVSSEYVNLNSNSNDNNTPSTSAKYGVTTDNLNMRESDSTSSSIITTIKKGTKVEIIEKTSSSWYKIKYSGKTGYVSSKYITLSNNSSDNNTPSTSSKSGTTTASLNMRKSASSSASIITTIPKGSKVEILEKTSSTWYKVKYSGKTGYSASQYIK
ncbi:MAG: SH3 domain-containing protein [Terrisporobacter sp.]